MKNIQVIDGAENCVYDVFAASDETFALIFTHNTDIAFAEDLPDQALNEIRGSDLNAAAG